MSSSRYSRLPLRPSEESDPLTAPNAPLIPSSIIPTTKTSTTTLTLPISIFLRIPSTIFALTAFLLYVLGGGKPYIAADVFLGIILLWNFIVWIIHAVCSVFSITFELKGRKGGVEGAKKGRRCSGWVDLGLSACLVICMIVGTTQHTSNRRYYYERQWNGAQIAGAIFAYLVVLLQALIAVPWLDNTKISISILREKEGGIRLQMDPRDFKAPVQQETSERGGESGSPSNRTSMAVERCVSPDDGMLV